MAFYQIPLSSFNQVFSIRLGQQNLKFQTIYRIDTWYLDILESDGSCMISALPMVQGTDLLTQYQHILKGALYVLNNSKNEGHSFGGLGTDIELYWEDKL